MTIIQTQPAKSQEDPQKKQKLGLKTKPNLNSFKSVATDGLMWSLNLKRLTQQFG